MVAKAVLSKPERQSLQNVAICLMHGPETSTSYMQLSPCTTSDALATRIPYGVLSSYLYNHDRGGSLGRSLVYLNRSFCCLSPEPRASFRALSTRARLPWCLDIACIFGQLAILKARFVCSLHDVSVLRLLISATRSIAWNGFAHVQTCRLHNRPPGLPHPTS